MHIRKALKILTNQRIEGFSLSNLYNLRRTAESTRKLTEINLEPIEDYIILYQTELKTEFLTKDAIVIKSHSMVALLSR